MLIRTAHVRLQAQVAVSNVPNLIEEYDPEKYYLSDTFLPENNDRLDEYIYHSQTGSEHFYYVVNHHKVEMTLTGYFLPAGDFVMDKLARHNNKVSMKAYEFYHRLTLMMSKPIHSSVAHSKGGLKTWIKLAEYKDIQLYHYTYNQAHGQEKTFTDLRKYIELHTDDFMKNYNLFTYPEVSRFEVSSK
jgi:hypothetical protein